MESILDTIQSDAFTAVDQIAWQHIRLLLLEPSWLQSPKRQQQQQAVVTAMVQHPKFTQLILDHYQFVSLFQQTPFHQEALLLTSAALQMMVGVLDAADTQRITTWSRTIIQKIIASPNEWTLFVNGADWLMDELQLEEGILYDFLHDITLAQTRPNAPQTAIESSIAHWIQQQKDSDIQALQASLARNDQRIQSLFENIERKHQRRKK